MSRDFIGGSLGRSFRQSPNRDRICRGTSLPQYSSIRFLSTRWGAYDWCLGLPSGVFHPVAIAPVRYRRIVIENTWDFGSRIDVVDYGDGLSEPVVTNIRADAPYGDVYPQGVLQRVTSATAVEIKMDVIDFGPPNHKRTIRLEDGVSIEDFKVETYLEFDAMNNFQHRTRAPDTGFGEQFDDRAYWTRGPITWTVSPDPLIPGVNRVAGALVAPFIGTILGISGLEHYPSAEKRFVELGAGSTTLGGIIPPSNGGVARLWAGGASALNSGIPSATNPNQIAGAIVIEGTAALGSFWWQMDMTKVNMQSEYGIVQKSGTRLGIPTVPFTEFDISPQTLPGGILNPVDADELTFYGLTTNDPRFPFYYARVLVPPYALLP